MLDLCGHPYPGDMDRCARRLDSTAGPAASVRPEAWRYYAQQS
jgi:hypothetical protein